ncbi:MAG: FkbM family methyltransferase [Candidatus Rokubacteria bacterium]|nr:FkbM family methyltransferase [Candidatus Rokubacteria bacterium]
MKLAFRSDYRDLCASRAELARIKSAPRYTPLVSEILGSRLQIVDGASFCASYHEIFEREIYAFRPASDAPLIIDGGANVGVSVLYFKKHYPKSRIVAFEADPTVFSVLEANLHKAGHGDVQLINKALWKEDTVLEFCIEGADAGRIPREDDRRQPKKIRVPTVRLRQYLTDPVDLLKLDIEGAETEVLLDCADLLKNVSSLFVEYHSFLHEEQRLDVVFQLLRTAGFRIYVQTVTCPSQPFIKISDHLGMDLQLNIFGTREA